MIRTILKIVFFPVTLAASIVVGAILGALGMISYIYIWTFNERTLWKRLNTQK